jgi:hypothetical protein
MLSSQHRRILLYGRHENRKVDFYLAGQPAIVTRISLTKKDFKMPYNYYRIFFTRQRTAKICHKLLERSVPFEVTYGKYNDEPRFYVHVSEGDKATIDRLFETES